LYTIERLLKLINPGSLNWYKCIGNDLKAELTNFGSTYWLLGNIIPTLFIYMSIELT